MVKVIRKSDAKLWARLNAFVNTFHKQTLKVGWFSTARYENGVPVAYVATIHEFGAPSQGIPPRPFMRPTIVREEPHWRDIIEQEAKKIVGGTQTPENLLEILGLLAAGEIARSIAELTEPGLADSTIAARKRKMADTKTEGALNKPLVETGLMLASVSYTVSDGTPIKVNE